MVDYVAVAQEKLRMRLGYEQEMEEIGLHQNDDMVTH